MTRFKQFITACPVNPTKTRTVCPVLLCALLLTACNRQPAAPPAPPPEVATITVAPRPVTLTTELPGRTSPYRIAEIRPQVNGLIQKRLFEEGSDVQAGQVLYQIDPAPFQAALDNAAAALGRAEANLPAVRSRLERYQQGALGERAVQNLRLEPHILRDTSSRTISSKQAVATFGWSPMLTGISRASPKGNRRG